MGAPYIYDISRLRVKVATVEQQQRTDRLDISSTVDSAGVFMLVAAATIDVFLFTFFSLTLETPVRKLATKMFDFLLLCAYASTESKDFLFLYMM